MQHVRVVNVPRALALLPLVVGCHLDKLVNGGGGPVPPSHNPPAGLVFATEPGAPRAGQTMTPPVRVSVVDSTGTPVASAETLTVTVTLARNPAGATLRGTTSAHPVDGVATFSDLRLDKVAAGYALGASAGALPATMSDTFTVAPGPAVALAFTVEPSNAAQDSAIAPPVQVTAYDSLGNIASTFTGTVRVALGTDASVTKNARLTGTTAVAAAGGVARFANLHVDQIGTGYTLNAALGSAAPVATSAPFDITPGLANQPPTAAFNSSCTQLTCSFTSSSSDPDGSIASYAWTFGDGGTATAQNPSHTYAAGGTYTVTLTVTDNQNATGSVSHTVTVTAPPPPTQPPVVNAGGNETVLIGALYTLTASFGDPDNDGPWTYTIDWGDGSSSSGTRLSTGSFSASHSYAAVLTSYTVTVTVVDSHGNQGSDSKVVTVVLL